MLKKINLDVSRFIAALMITAIHIYPLASFSESLDYTMTRIIFRIAVPLFLMITGYFIIPKSLDNINNLKTYTKKILKLYLISILIFLPINIYNGYFTNFSILNFLKDLLFNGTFYHLWYFPGLILGLWLTYIFVKKLKPKTTFILISFLFLIGILGDNYYGLVSNITFFEKLYNLIFSVFEYTRNGLFYMPIFIYLGYIANFKKPKISFKKHLLLNLIFLSLMIIEGLLLYTNNIPRHSSMYFLLIPLSYYLFTFILNYTKGTNKTLRSISTWIYILHPLFIVIIHFASKIVHLESLFSNTLINYLSVLTSTILFILFIKKLKEVITHERRN